MAAHPPVLRQPKREPELKGLLLSTGLTVAAMIMVPALASRFGLGSAMTGAVRLALLRLSSRAVKRREEGGDVGSFSCH